MPANPDPPSRQTVRPAVPAAGTANDPDSALPSVGARVVAFLSILVGGATGGLIGAAFARLGGFEGVSGGLVLLVSSLLGAGGVAVVAVLTLRALGEWETVRRRDAAADGPGT